MSRSRMLGFATVILILTAIVQVATAVPNGADFLYNSTETKVPAAAHYINTSGGTFTTLILYAETQNPRWKAYAGNVSGYLTLDDASNYTIYNWERTITTGEVYTSRNSSVDWTNINCSGLSMIYQEEAMLNHVTTHADSINSTFKYRKHRGFFSGTREIKNSTCPSTATWVNDTAQAISEDALFQEMLLSDGVSLVYATLLQDKVSGFNTNKYDFQMIVAERDDDGTQATPYYFWLELV